MDFWAFYRLRHVPYITTRILCPEADMLTANYSNGDYKFYQYEAPLNATGKPLCVKYHVTRARRVKLDFHIK